MSVAPLAPGTPAFLEILAGCGHSQSKYEFMGFGFGRYQILIAAAQVP
jgi:hypothetical protein